jgi:hypothetical protein
MLNPIKKRPYQGMNPKFPLHPIFSSNFESGNLDVVIYIENLEYDLYMRVDTNTFGHN